MTDKLALEEIRELQLQLRECRDVLYKVKYLATVKDYDAICKEIQEYIAGM
jgi:hypothetical protein